MAPPTVQTTWCTIAVILSVALIVVFADPAPGPRDGGCAFTYNNRFYILGGDGSTNATSNPFAYTNFPLDLSQPVVWHTATPNVTIIHGKLTDNYLKPCVVTTNGTLIVGGNDLVGYDIQNDTWLGRIEFNGTVPKTLFQPFASWENNYERVVQINDSLWIFEDFKDGNATPGSDIYILNLTTLVWTTMKQVGEIPAAILFTALCYVPPGVDGMNETIFMVGGEYTKTIWMFDLKTYRWTSATQELLTPVDHLKLFYYPSGKMIYAFPGGTANGITNVMQVINLAFSPFQIYNFTPTQSDLPFQPSARDAASVVKQGNTFVVYGGLTTMLDGNLYIFDMAAGSWVQQAPMTAAITLSTAISNAVTISSIASASTTIGTNFSAGPSGPSSSLIAAVVVVVVIVVVVLAVGLFIYRKRKNSRNILPILPTVQTVPTVPIMPILTILPTLPTSE
ncbi:hypothetical protein BC937DRAFT_92731 [Endogone sp. FLAS-F59071]|nr:hypothetical protein BC937DRAFT_92731 [Endogone sp. FLAS-F59071]|eukprot:RUS15219.1 hypothetical protein BC937DRAFT_92731 [Endogone sp. FLAS-F59071]